MIPHFDADFGLKPEGLRPATGKVRLEMSKVNVIFQYVMTSLVSLGGLFMGGFLFIGQPFASVLFNILTGLAFLFFAGVLVFFLGVRGSHFWVEQDGDVIRFKNQPFEGAIRRRVFSLCVLCVCFVLPTHERLTHGR